MLWKIARDYDTTVDAILEANEIENRNLIYTGQVLNIPEDVEATDDAMNEESNNAENYTQHNLGEHVAYYDLFRLEDGLIVEHWDVIENIPAEDDWMNDNGKF